MEKQRLKVLIIEDSPGDVELLQGMLIEAGYDMSCRQVDDVDSLREALSGQVWDLIISDYTLPRFNGADALRIYKDCDLDCPFIIVSGTIGEEAAISVMKAGAHDYILKDNLVRLVPAIRREISEARSRALRRQAERQLRASEEKFRMMAESVPQIIWTSGPEGDIDYCNRRWFDETGLDEGVSLGRGWQEALHPEDARTCLKAWREALESGIPFETECRFRRGRDGEYLWYLWRCHAVRDESGDIAKWFGSFTDIDRRKRDEMALKKWEQVFSHAGWGVAMIDPEDKILKAVNPAFAAMHGYDESRMLGMPFDAVLAPQSREGFPESLRNLRWAGHLLYETVHCHREGREFPVLTDITVIKDAGGNTLHYAANFQDITRQKEAEKLMRDANERLMRLNQLRSEFTSMISHELKTPLTVIKEGVHLVLEGSEGPLTDEQRETLAVTGDNIDRLSRMIRTVLNFEKIESGCWRTNFHSVNLNGLVTELCELMRLACRKKAIRLVCDVPLDELKAVCDADKIKQVLLNLVDNAIKFTPKEGEIRVRLWRQGESGCLEVRDNGVGIRKEDHEKIFEMFTQGFNSGETAAYGMGVGLAVCKKIMIEHGGNIRVESEFGHGARFSVDFPLKRPAGEESAA
jgi:PAS domain S-box-containing protein